jgi:hypothetical protein
LFVVFVGSEECTRDSSKMPMFVVVAVAVVVDIFFGVK